LRIGVTGGAGFIGSHVVDVLHERGHDPLIFDHLGRRGLAAEVMLGDTRDDVAVTELAAHVEGIIHLASVLGTQETVHNPRPAVMTNVISGMNVFEAGVQHGLPVVNIAVGNAGFSNPYSASKTCVETLGHMYVRDRGLALNQVRLVNAYGPRQSVAAPYGTSRVRKIMPAFVCRALTGAPVEIYGDGKQVSDMVWVRDGALALVLALEAAAAGNVVPGVMECGPEEHTSVRHIAGMVVDAARLPSGKRSEIKHLPMRPGETPGAYVVADPSTLAPIGMKAIDLKPLAAGIEETVAWYAEHWLPTWRDTPQQWCLDGRNGDCGWCAKPCRDLA
jgi:UDP-glucose 4-epimerase